MIPIFKLGKVRLREIIYNLAKIPGSSSKSMSSQLYHATEMEQGESTQINTMHKRNVVKNFLFSG